MKIFSFFSGAGLLDLGFEDNGFEIAMVNELNPAFVRAYQFNRPEATPDYQVKSIEDLSFDMPTDEVTGFIGGPPCPDFSKAGQGWGKNGHRGSLSGIYVDIIIAKQPHFFLFENVRGMWSSDRHRAYYHELRARLVKAGYNIHDEILNSLEFGVPQDRDRVIMVGWKPGLFHKPLIIRRQYNLKEVKALPWPTTAPFGSKVEIPKGILKQLTVQHWFEENRTSVHPNGVDHFKPYSGKFYQVKEGETSTKYFRRLHRWRYSPTAAYGNNEVHLHPYHPRRLSAAEVMAIQSLPPTFELPQGMHLSDMFKCLANGVPYLMANQIAWSLKGAMK